MTAILGQSEAGSPADDYAALNESLIAVPNELEKLKTQHETHLKAIKGRFNIFTVLRGFDEETGLHSRYLAHLLNPQEKSWGDSSHHDCGSLFLELFIKTLKEHDVLRHDGESCKLDQLRGYDCKNANVSPEFFINLMSQFPEYGKNGYIDLLIELPGWGFIAIENKTRRGEQDKQIERYATWLKHNKKSFIILFLTPEGIASETAGKFKEQYFRISYREHILPWLEACLRETYRHVGINQALQQYKNVIAQLLGRTPMEEEYMNNMKELLSQHPGIVRHLEDIRIAVVQFRGEYYKSFWDHVRQALRGKGMEVKGNPDNPFGAWWESDCPMWKLSIENNKSVLLRDQFSMVIWYDLKNKPNEEVYICMAPEPLGDKAALFENEMRDIGLHVEQRGYWRVARQLRNPFSNEALSKLIGKDDQLNAIAAECARAISSYIDAAESVWQKLARTNG